MKPSGYLLTLQ
jgi:hypothetical protein